MNIVIDDAVEVYVKDAKPRREIGESLRPWNWVASNDPLRPIGRILLKGDNITLIQQIV